MSWAMRRRGVVAAIIIVVLGAVGVWGYYAFLYDAPSCSDFRQNQDEEGIDCGGVCDKICDASLAVPQVAFVRPVVSGPGRSDVIAYVENPNFTAMAEDVKYTVELFNSQNVLVATKEGVMDLYPKRNPLFIPNLFSGEETTLRAFLTLDASTIEWFDYEDTRVTMNVRDVRVEHADTLPRIYATIENASYTNSYKNIPMVVTVFNEEGNAIAASQTVIPQLRAEGAAQVVFTWNAPFSETAVRQEFIPILPDPS